jgi:hypothetical protein
MDAGIAAAGLDVPLEGGLLGVGEEVAGRGEEDDDVVLREVGVVELRRVLGRVDLEVVVGAERLDRRDPLGDGVVAEAGGLGRSRARRPGPPPRR